MRRREIPEGRSRRTRWLTGTLAALGILAAAGLGAQEMLKTALHDDAAPHWIYDDFPRAVEQAKATGKPILAVVRCVP